MSRYSPAFSNSYAFAIEFVFEEIVHSKYPDALIEFSEIENGMERGMKLEITLKDKELYTRITNFVSKRRCIENFFEDMVKKAL